MGSDHRLLPSSVTRTCTAFGSSNISRGSSVGFVGTMMAPAARVGDHLADASASVKRECGGLAGRVVRDRPRVIAPSFPPLRTWCVAVCRIRRQRRRPTASVIRNQFATPNTRRNPAFSAVAGSTSRAATTATQRDLGTQPPHGRRPVSGLARLRVRRAGRCLAQEQGLSFGTDYAQLVQGDRARQIGSADRHARRWCVRPSSPGYRPVVALDRANWLRLDAVGGH